jgi:TolB-like protein
LSKAGITRTLLEGKKLPPIEGLDYLVTGTLAGDALSTEAVVKFIAVGKKQPGVVAHTFIAKGVTTPAILPLVRKLVSDIRAAFPLWGSIVEVQGEQVALSLGQDDGVQMGDVFEVEAWEGKDARRTVGTLEVIEVQAEQSIARSVKIDRPLARGIRIRMIETRPTAETTPAAETLIGILPFQNYTGDPALDWVGKGIGATLTTMLNALKGFRLVERQQLDQLMSEQRLQASALFDPQTVVETGRLWKTRYLILGGYQKLREFYRLDGWRVDTETGEVFEAQGIVGQELFALQQELGERLREAIDRSNAVLPKSPSPIEGITIGVRHVETIPTAVYHLLGTLQAPIVEYTLENTTASPITLSVSTEILGYTHLSKETVELPASGVRVVHQIPAFQNEQLASIVQQRTTSLHLRVAALIDESEQILFEQQRTVTLLPYNTLLWSLESADGQRIDLLPALAAWVSPNSPTVAKLLREAADYSPSHRIAGYQNPTLLALPSSDETQTQRLKAVREEARAIYQMLKERYKLRYVDQSTQYPNERGQRILLPDESLNYQSANCIDGTVLWASLLYRAGINPLIILVPGHAFIGWEVWPDTGRYDVLETTQLGIGDFDAASEAGWKQAEAAGIAEALRVGIQFSREGKRAIGQAMLLSVWILKERCQLAEIPLSRENVKRLKKRIDSITEQIGDTTCLSAD